MTCSEIESLLPAYLERLLPPEQQETIDGHLASCPGCSRACGDLRKAQGLLQDLPEVEPPPFFEQRIMARVREEAAQKQGILRKFFYPLYIKIPLQAFATLVVAVTAFSIYRTILPEVKDLAPPAIMAPEPAKDRPRVEPRGAPAAPAAVKPATRAPAADLAAERKQEFAAPPRQDRAKAVRPFVLPPPQPEKRAPAAQSAAPAAAAGETERPPLHAEGLRGAPERLDRREADPSLEAPLPRPAAKGRAAVMGAAPAPSQTRDAAVRPSAVHLTIQAKDVPSAVREVETHLAHAEGRLTERQRRDAGELLKAEIPVHRFAAFLDGIAAVGAVEVEKGPPDVRDGIVTVVMVIAGGS
jgi:hypothetical protein